MATSLSSRITAASPLCKQRPSLLTFPSFYPLSAVSFLSEHTNIRVKKNIKSPPWSFGANVLVSHAASAEKQLSPRLKASPSYGAAAFDRTLPSFVRKEAILRQENSRETISSRLHITLRSVWTRGSSDIYKIPPQKVPLVVYDSDYMFWILM